MRSVLIAGGGIGGLATALALARRGHAVTVFERSREFGEIGAGLQLGPNGMRALHRLGCAGEVLHRAVPVRHLRVLDGATGTLLVQVDLLGAFRERFGHPYVVAHRAHLHAVLLSACRSSGRVRLHAGSPVTDLRHDDAGVAVQVADDRWFLGSTLVGADGLHSVVRTRVLDDGPPRPSGHTTYRAVLPAEVVPAHLRPDSATLWAAPGRHAVHYPIDGGRQVNVVVTVDNAATRPVSGAVVPAVPVLKAFARFASPVRDLMALVPRWTAWVLCDREPVARWGAGRITLLGDAAHPMVQYAAQGACMALEDAVELAHQVDAHEDIVQALHRYAEIRAPRTGRVQRTARALGSDFYHLDGARALERNALLSSLTQEELQDRLAWLYEDHLSPDGSVVTGAGSGRGKTT